MSAPMNSSLASPWTSGARAAGSWCSRPGSQPAEMFAESDNAFFLKVVDAQITFVADTDGKVAKMVFKQGDRVMEMKKANSAL